MHVSLVASKKVIEMVSAYFGYRRGQFAVLEKVESLEKLLEEQGSINDLLAKLPTKRHVNSHSTDLVKRSRAHSASLWGWVTETTGLTCTVVKKQSFNCNDFSLHIRSELPFIAYAFLFECSFRTFPLCWSIHFLPGGGAGFSRVIPDDSAFMLACLRGQLLTVREMCRIGEGRPDDVSKKNMTPLLVSNILTNNRGLISYP
jgi:hypothetical protein